MRRVHGLGKEELKRLASKPSEDEGVKLSSTPAPPTLTQTALQEEFERIVKEVVTDPEVISIIRNALSGTEGEAPATQEGEVKEPETYPLPEGAVRIGEEIEVPSEKINFKVALNPEIFYFYDVFKAEAERRGNKWEGDFGDFLYMAAKDALTTHGILPAVVRLKEGQLILKVPMEEGD
jgi:hypothetical protein